MEGFSCIQYADLLSKDDAHQEVVCAIVNMKGVHGSRVWLKGTRSSKKKKQAKLKRVMATVKRAERKDVDRGQEGFAALHLLHDPQVGAGVSMYAVCLFRVCLRSIYEIGQMIRSVLWRLP